MATKYRCQGCGVELYTHRERHTQHETCDSCRATNVSRSYKIAEAMKLCHRAIEHGRPRAGDPDILLFREPDSSACCYLHRMPEMCPPCQELKQRIETGDLKLKEVG
jgi:hypothetical protein